MISLATSEKPWDDVLELARGRGILPSHLSSVEGREVFLKAARDRDVFSARTTSATYLQGLRDRLVRMMTGDYESDRPQLRLELKQILADLAYDPETGFPGDRELEIPPAEEGSLRDLSSTRRIDFILETQERLLRGAAQKTRGLDRIELFPAWELIRVRSVETPRGEENTTGWPRRWMMAEGPAPVLDNGRARLVAHKTDLVWSRLGDEGLFDDALGVDHPPFAFGSGMGWRELPAREWDALAVGGRTEEPAAVDKPSPADSLPPVALPGGLSPDLVKQLLAKASPAHRAQLERRRQGR